MLLFLDKSYYNKIAIHNILIKIKESSLYKELILPNNFSYKNGPLQLFTIKPVIGFSKIQADGSGNNPCCEFPNFVTYK
jgi:hypothetical protein